ncbi:hypothetical protein [Paenibacillus medicaginis]|uniref:Phage protein n=1 Tax=Paenibacillus medicaginis TaxID=1470560 RepID=A0ABV5BUK0_9BACL
MNGYIVFFNYKSGHREFGFYSDLEEAKRRMSWAINDSVIYGSKVEIGIAEILTSEKINWNE